MSMQPRVEILEDDDDESVTNAMPPPSEPPAPQSAPKEERGESTAMERAGELKARGNDAFAREDYEEAMRL